MRADTADENVSDDPPPPYEQAPPNRDGPISGTDHLNQSPSEGCASGSSTQAPRPSYTTSTQRIDSINYQIPPGRRKRWIDGTMQGFREHLTLYEKSQLSHEPLPNRTEEEGMNERYNHQAQAIIDAKDAENYFKQMFVISGKYASKDELFTTIKESVTNNPVHLAMFEEWYQRKQSIYDGCA